MTKKELCAALVSHYLFQELTHNWHPAPNRRFHFHISANMEELSTNHGLTANI